MRRALCGRWHRVFRCTVNARRTLSIESPFWKTVNSTKCSAFLDRVSQNLLATKTGADLNTPHSSTTISYWERIVQSKFKFETIRDEIEQLNQLEASEDADQSMRTMIEKDRTALQESLVEAVDHLVEAIVPLENLDMLNKCQMEFSSGAGGIEAMMFTNELMNMYEQFCQRCGWSWTVFEFEGGQQGGVRFALVSIEGDRVYSKLRFEAGVHRVQRIPVTDKSRIHTSTSSISVMPEPEEAQVEIPSHEVEYEAIRASGPGGQNVNKRSSAVRLTHLPTGIAVHCMDERFQHLNLQKVDSQQGQRTSARRLQVVIQTDLNSRFRESSFLFLLLFQSCDFGISTAFHAFKTMAITGHQLASLIRSTQQKLVDQHLESYKLAIVGLLDGYEQVVKLRRRIVQCVEDQKSIRSFRNDCKSEDEAERARRIYTVLSDSFSTAIIAITSGFTAQHSRQQLPDSIQSFDQLGDKSECQSTATIRAPDNSAFEISAIFSDDENNSVADNAATPQSTTLRSDASTKKSMDYKEHREIMLTEYLNGGTPKSALALICAKFGPKALHISTVRSWFVRFNSGDKTLRDRRSFSVL
ncbi:RF-PROK-I domain-containing protein [Aphelenchoides besseyi]|nr:RF-PROK-I domain-containing protein [Aphelenchoides besseyi]